MKITKTQIGDLNYLLNVNVHQEDYKHQVEKKLITYGKNISIRGFRKGKIPINILRSKYEKYIVNDIISSVVQNHIEQFLHKEKIRILDIIPLDNKIDTSNITFDLSFEFCVYPNIQIKDVMEVIKKYRYTYYKVDNWDAQIGNYLSIIQCFFSNIIDRQLVNMSDYIQLKVMFFSNDNNFTIVKQLFLNLHKLPSYVSKFFIEYKVNDIINLNRSNIKDNKVYNFLWDICNFTHELINKSKVLCNIIITKCFNIKLIDMNKNFYDIIFNHDIKISNYKNILMKDYGSFFYYHNIISLLKNMYNDIIKDLNISLPNDFILRFVKYKYPNMSNNDAVNQGVKYSSHMLYKFIMNILIQEFKLFPNNDPEIKHNNDKLYNSSVYYYMGLKYKSLSLMLNYKSILSTYIENKFISDKIFNYIVNNNLSSFNNETISCVDFIKRFISGYYLFT
jgi:trigger factor